MSSNSYPGAETYELDINEHPEVKKAVEDATAAINSASISISQGMYIEALTNGINMAETRRREKNPTGPKYVRFYINTVTDGSTTLY